VAAPRSPAPGTFLGKALDRDQAEAASETLLEDSQDRQRAFAYKIRTRYRPFADGVRIVLMGVCGFGVGSIAGEKYGSLLVGGLLGSIGGVAYAIVVSRTNRKDVTW